jgi:hypothetical protein
VTELAERAKVPHPHRKNYTDLEIDAGLTAYAICSGRMKLAAALVKEQSGMEIPAETIRSWASRSYPDRYQRIRLEVAPKLQTQMADTHQALAQTAAEMEAEAVEKLQARIKQGDVEDKDLANIYKATAIAGGIHTEKAELLNGRPTQRKERTAAEVLRGLQGKGVMVLEERAEEVEGDRRVSVERRAAVGEGDVAGAVVTADPSESRE